MAKGKAKAAKPAKKKSGGSRSSANGMLVLLTCAALVPFSLPTLLILFVGMLPTLGAVIAEKGNNRYAWVCVGGLNFSGLAPWLFKLWFGHHTMTFALEQITGITMLMVAYGGAACGWLLYLSVPPIVQTFLAMTSKSRADGLTTLQKRLIDQWGDTVTKDMDMSQKEQAGQIM